MKSKIDSAKNFKLRRRKSTIVVLMMFVIIIVISLGYNTFLSFNDHVYNVTVTDKNRIVKGDSSYYLVFTEDELGNVHVFKNEDSVIRLKFDSSNMQGRLQIGNEYTITTIGYRIPILDMYENIIDIEE